MPVSEVLDMSSCLKIIPIRKYYESGKRTPRGVWLKKIFTFTTQDVDILKKTFGNLRGISRICTPSVGNNKANNCVDRQQVCHTFFSKQMQFHQHSGVHVLICCNLTSEKRILLVQSTLQLIFSPDLSLKSRRRYVSKSGKISKQHLL